MGFQVKAYDNIVTDMVSWIVAHAPEITDLTPGSVIRSFCEATAMTLEELYVATYLGFRRYLAQIPELVFDFTKVGGSKATVSCIFSRSGSTGTVVIPLGTSVETGSGLIFFTTVVSEISDGNTDSDSVEVEAEEIGVLYNVLGNTITVLTNEINGVETVDNALPATGGINQETDYQYAQRFQAYIEGLAGANIAGLITGALSVSGITSVSVYEHFPPLSNVNANVYVDDNTVNGVDSAKVAEVQAVIDGTGTVEDPGYRAAGVNVVVAAPGIVSTNITMSVSITAGVDGDQVESDIELALVNYVNSLGIGADIVYNELITAVMGVFGVYNCDITAPSGDVSISTSQVGRVGTVSITVG